jgi:hypothetical protein
MSNAKTNDKTKEVKLSPAEQLVLVNKRIASKEGDIAEARAILSGYRKRKEMLEFRDWKANVAG